MPATQARTTITDEAPPPVPMRLVLLGGFELYRDAQPLAVPLNGQRLLAFLAVHDHPVPRALVAGTLWMDTGEERAAARLRSALWRIQQLDRCLLQATSACLALGAQVAVDVRECQVRSRRLLDPSRPADAWELQAPWPTGELLPGWYEEWVIIARERSRQLSLHALEARCARLAELGRFAEAIDAGLAAIAAEPLRESAHQVLIRAYLAEGNRGEALHQYAFYRRLLARELGLAPSPALQALIAPLLRR